MKITIARALKVKNRLAEKLARSVGEVRKYNSIRSELENPINVEAAWKEQQELRKNIVNLKAAISRANTPIVDQIYKVAELKSEIAAFQGLDVTEGKSFQSSRLIAEEKVIEYVAYLNKKTLDDYMENLRKELDSIQEKLEYFNTQTWIEIDFDA